MIDEIFFIIALTIEYIFIRLLRFMTSNSLYIRDYRKEVPGKIADDGFTWEFPVVTTKTSHGKESNWKIYVRLFTNTADIILPDVPDEAFMDIEDSYYENVPDNVYGWIKVDTGIEGTISKRVPTIVKSGKNAGKASATNVWTQSLRDAYGLYNKQAKKADVTMTNTDNDKKEKPDCQMYPPMLAQVFSAQKSMPEITKDNPVFVQPKYNGVRAIAMLCKETNGDYNVVLYSRKRNIYPGFTYIKNELLVLLQNYYTQGKKIYLDGELYKHGVALQDISGYARREDKADDIKLDFMVYDCFIPDEPKMTYLERFHLLTTIFHVPENANKIGYSFPVPTQTVTNSEEINPIYKTYLEANYEGAMVRLNEPYQYSYNDYHCKSLLKIKPVFDMEMEISGYTTGLKGKAAGALMIKCKTNEGKEFPVTPAMELPIRIEFAKKMGNFEPNGKTHFVNHWLGKKIIIEYDELSKDKVPLRARTSMVVRTWD